MTWDALQRETLEALGHTLYEPVAPTLPALPDDALLHAVLRALACDADSAEARAVWHACRPLHALRDASAKRALWPRVRGLRSVRAS